MHKANREKQRNQMSRKSCLTDKLTIVLLYRSRSSILVKMTLRHFWKDDVECVHHSQEVVVNKIQAQGQELPTEEQMSEVDLQQAIKQV